MILTIDAGNTTISLGGARATSSGGYAFSFRGRISSRAAQTSSVLAEELDALLSREGVDTAQFRGCVLSSVVPALTQPLLDWGKLRTGREPLLITRLLDTGLTVALPHPEKVGLDRLVDSAWAAARHPLPAVTVDLGTATTFNVIGEGAVFLGGIICPGIRTSLRSLQFRTAQLPAITLSTPHRIIGRTTEECMRSGVVGGAAAMVDGLTARIEQELGSPVTLLLTGGFSPMVSPLCRHPHLLDPDLLSRGLAYLYDRNRPLSPS